MKKRRLPRVWPVLFGTILVLGCAGSEEKSELLSLLGVDEKIVDASDQGADNTYDAITLLKRGEAYFVKGEYIEAVSEFERFLSLYPFHRMAAFSQYKLAMSYFHQINTIDRDPAPMEKALVAFQKVLLQYPQSLYVDEAREKVETLRHRQAEHQFYIGRFYYRTKAYPAAIARLEKVLERSDEGPLTEKTLYLLGLSHRGIGDAETALEIFRKLLTQFPESSYTEKIKKIEFEMKAASFAS